MLSGISNLYVKVWCRPTWAYLDTLIHSLFYLEPKLPSELKRVIPIIKTNLRHTSAIALFYMTPYTSHGNLNYWRIVIYKNWYYGQTHIILTFYFRSQSWKDQGQSQALAQSRAGISLVVCPFLYIYFFSQFTRNKRKGQKRVEFERAIEQVPNSAQGGDENLAARNKNRSQQWYGEGER